MREHRKITEIVRPSLLDLDLRPTTEIVRLLVESTDEVASAVRGATEALAAAVEEIAARFSAGGRLIYVGAGTSGNIASLDAAECGPTFGVDEDRVVALVPDATRGEAAEDDAESGARDAAALLPTERDAVVGVSASGDTPYVRAALEHAASAGALTACVVCNPNSALAAIVDHAIEIVTGPEIVAGSSRLKAGTAQKIALNTISTATMVKAGRTFGNLMINVSSGNEKLRERALSMLVLASGATVEEARGALEDAGGNVATALVALARDTDSAGAARLLSQVSGDVRAAIVGRDGSGRRGDAGGRLGVGAALVDGALVPGDVEIVDGRVARVGLSPPGSGIAAPGFVDLQVNGYAGVDFLTAEPADFARAASALLAAGVTAFQPTLITAPEEAIVAALHRLATPPPAGARILGVHLEGPFLSPDRLGTHLPDGRRDPDRVLMGRLLDAGPVTYVTIAPELPGALELIEWVVGRGVIVSLGHTQADAGQARAAFARGARTVTHLFNAMRSMRARDPGLAGAALISPDVTVQMIVDGHHVSPEIALLAWRGAKGRVALVTDAVAAAGMPDGAYHLGGVDIELVDGVVRRADGTLAGSALSMLDAVRNIHSFGAPLEESLNAATALPARIAGRPDVGTIAPGSVADVVVLDDALDLRRVLRGGREVEAAAEKSPA